MSSDHGEAAEKDGANERTLLMGYTNCTILAASKLHLCIIRSFRVSYAYSKFPNFSLNNTARTKCSEKWMMAIKSFAQINTILPSNVVQSKCVIH